MAPVLNAEKGRTVDCVRLCVREGEGVHIGFVDVWRDGDRVRIEVLCGSCTALYNYKDSYSECNMHAREARTISYCVCTVRLPVTSTLYSIPVSQYSGHVFGQHKLYTVYKILRILYVSRFSTMYA